MEGWPASVAVNAMTAEPADRREVSSFASAAHRRIVLLFSLN